MKELLGRGFSDSRNGSQLRLYRRVAPFLAMVGDAEAVRLVANLLQYLQRFGSLVDVQGSGISGKVDFFQPFGDPDHRHLPPNAQLVQTLQRGAQLPLASVYDDELR